MYDNFDNKAYHEVMDEEYGTKNYNKNDKITITLEEYKELLIIKGKYEELKNYHKPTIIRDDKSYNKEIPIVPYKVTLENEKGVCIV